MYRTCYVNKYGERDLDKRVLYMVEDESISLSTEYNLKIVDEINYITNDYYDSTLEIVVPFKYENSNNGILVNFEARAIVDCDYLLKEKTELIDFEITKVSKYILPGGIYILDNYDKIDKLSQGYSEDRIELTTIEESLLKHYNKESTRYEEDRFKGIRILIRE